ncbi:hypothetical protein CesoFtcFv8_012670 [Champsocephalus esox]|uniref:Uncharacterized protein n=1 Tax=Champsocephalus esox TaxID=159716 RepID=A0AAN8BY40_9TELE|nr:hypothetical protein CesoFtcFv8_012670 [Champsocephalus esox]
MKKVQMWCCGLTCPTFHHFRATLGEFPQRRHHSFQWRRRLEPKDMLQDISQGVQLPTTRSSETQRRGAGYCGRVMTTAC